MHGETQLPPHRALMVSNDVWKAAGMGEGFLCIGCLEIRLGRTLTAADFPAHLPINDPDPWDTPRLANRKDTK